MNAEFATGGGIYPNANVTYRGVTIGRVEQLGLNHDGVVANMAQQRHAGPENVTATVKSARPRSASSTSTWCPEAGAGQALAAILRDGDTIGQDRTFVGQDVADLLAQADQLVSSIDNARLRTCCRRPSRRSTDPGPNSPG